MTGAVTKIFILLIAVVLCVVVGAFLINIVMPGMLQGVSNAIEAGIKSATGITLDINGDGINPDTQIWNSSSNTDAASGGQRAADNTNQAQQNHGVQGFQGSGGFN